jgi:O-antigen ligase
MKKIFSWISGNILFVLTLFLLAFIPLFPKIPLLDIKHTWVYIRAEDFLVFLTLLFWVALLFRKKITFKTPLTVPILAFWIIGAVATIHGIILLFPTLANVYPNVAYLHYLRHIQYLSLFFIAYSAMRDKNFLKFVIVALILILVAVSLYGLGQRFLGFPAYMTMDEELAKGIPVKLSEFSRVPSTFAGHYDFAAYLVIAISILASLFFGFKNWFVKITIAATISLGGVMLFLTVSRVSFAALFIALFFVLLFVKRKLLLVFIPGALALIILAVIFQPSMFERFVSTIRETDVLVDAKTGNAIGNVKFVPFSYFENKKIDQGFVKDLGELQHIMRGGKVDELADPQATESGEQKPLHFPDKVPVVSADFVSTGENLPQGTGYINLSLSPVIKRLGSFFYERKLAQESTVSAQAVLLHGDFIVKRAAAYDLSFTTRFQGGWPNALEMFGKNVFLGSGYGSVGLAVDNNYIRILGETGLLGLASFFGIFLTIGIYIKKVLPEVRNKVARNFALGYFAGVIGLAVNATFIDVFAASKVALSLWLLTGIVLGTLALYQKKPWNLYPELKKAATSSYAFIFYLLLLTVAIFSPMINNFFTGDDFTWLRWAADCNYSSCNSVLERIYRYFFDSQGFFYRPGTKIFFASMYSLFWLNQVVYHIASIALHFIVSALFFLLARKILKSNILAGIGAILFLLMSGYSEAVFWISSIGYLFNAAFALLAILAFILYEEKKQKIYYAASLIFISLGFLFHEVGVVTPLLIIAYKVSKEGFGETGRIVKKIRHLFLFVPVLVYLLVRFLSQSHWFSGDYSYDLLKLPFNTVGNLIGYVLMTVLGPSSYAIYFALRTGLRDNLLLAVILVPLVLLAAFVLYRIISKRLSTDEKKIAAFGLLFFVIALLPFLGLGNIASRYSYLPTLGLILVLALAIKKVYEYLIPYGRDIALMSMGVLIAIFSLLHIIQVQQIHGDWNTAGQKVQKFFVSIDRLYSDSWSESDLRFRFVNVPIKTGEAWVFPVGLSDALWFAFQNDNLDVYVHSSLSEALSLAGTSLTDLVFKFHDDGRIEEVIRFKDGAPVNALP